MMSAAESVLGINSPPRFRQHERRFLRAGRWLLWLTIVLAALGLFGEGLLSHADTSNADASLHLRYERFLRRGLETRLNLQLRSPLDPRQPFTLWIDRASFDRMQSLRITPHPLAMSLTEDRVFLELEEPASDDARHVAIDFQAEESGPATLSLGLKGDAGVTVTQFIFF